LAIGVGAATAGNFNLNEPQQGCAAAKVGIGWPSPQGSWLTRAALGFDDAM